MGKRVKVTKPQVPTVKLGPLRDPEEGQLKAVGCILPMVGYLLLGFLLLGFQQLRPVLFLVGWLIVGYIVILASANAQKQKLVKDQRRGKVTGTQHTEVRQALHEVAKLLDVKRVPETYVIESSRAAAVVRGMSSPYIILSSRLIEVLTEDEFRALLATLLGHIRAGNVYWRTFVATLRDAPMPVRLLALPYLPMATLMGGYLEVSHHSADKLALLVMDGDASGLAKTLVKVIAHTSDTLTDAQRLQLEQLTTRRGIEASATDVEYSYMLNRMMDATPGLRARISNITHAPADVGFQQQLAAMRERQAVLAGA